MKYKFRFPKSLRLFKRSQYHPVFAQPDEKIVRPSWIILSKLNQLGHSRLGLAISKKHAKRAVDRNRLKRIIRESFRNQALVKKGIDIVVLSRLGLQDVDNQSFRKGLDQAWEKLTKQYEKY